jgi:hypothetical protein
MEMFKIIETDTMTGWDRYLDNMRENPWTGTFTREQADASVTWREKNITRRYRYTVVAVQPWMTDPLAAASRHADRHGSDDMGKCSDLNCREATTKLMHDELIAKLAND